MKSKHLIYELEKTIENLCSTSIEENDLCIRIVEYLFNKGYEVTIIKSRIDTLYDVEVEKLETISTEWNYYYTPKKKRYEGINLFELLNKALEDVHYDNF